LIDPVPLQGQALEELTGSAQVGGIIVTNSNHHRFAAPYAQQFAVTTFAHGDTFPNHQPSRLKIVSDGDEICDGLGVIDIAGGPLGEIVLHYAVDGGTLIVGDALINFEPYGFAFLPAKYCSNQKQMRRSLRKLLDYKAKRILFAHGTPILAAASERLRALLNDGSS
jgi:glyoxylase-like metal-dependent hydrolase (beta-lactamase superfamily II)